MLKKIFYIIILIILAVAVFLSGSKNYDFIGCLIIFVIASAFTFNEFYKYYKNKKELSDICFTLERENLIGQLLYCALFVFNILMSAPNNTDSASDNIKIFMDIFVLVFIGFQLYITIFHLPKLSTKGFLCSNGSFISFNQIKAIKSEDNAFILSKKLIVEYDKKSKESFKVSSFDYENIEDHLKMYGTFSIEKEND